MGALKKSGVVQFANKILDKTGIYKADLNVAGKLIKDKTFFPITWSRKQVIEAICEVYDNYKNGASLQPGGKWLVEGVTTQGINIRMFITENGLITSAFPVLK